MKKERQIDRRYFRVVALLACAVPSAVSAGDGDIAQNTGLMWNRTGLPAVFPLQIKTAPGQDHVVTLKNSETGEDALAAFITGGEFFKVLVPPGVFDIHFTSGDAWQGEEKLFGPGEQTQFFELPSPLTFEVRNLGVKAGHLVDITKVTSDEKGHAEIRSQLSCQFLRTEFEPQTDVFPSHRWDFSDTPSRRLQDREDGLLDKDKGILNKGQHVTYPELELPIPRYVVTTRLCGW